MGTKSKVGPKGQITIPKDLREKHHLKEGETVTLISGKEGILILHEKQSLRGILAGKFDIDEFEKNLKELRSQWRLE